MWLHNKTLAEEIQESLATLTTKVDKLMAAIDDLNAAVAAMQTSVTNAVTEIQKLAAALTTPGITDAQAAAVSAQLNTLATNLQTAVTAGG